MPVLSTVRWQVFFSGFGTGFRGGLPWRFSDAGFEYGPVAGFLFRFWYRFPWWVSMVGFRGGFPWWVFVVGFRGGFPWRFSDAGFEYGPVGFRGRRHDSSVALRSVVRNVTGGRLPCSSLARYVLGVPSVRNTSVKVSYGHARRLLPF